MVEPQSAIKSLIKASPFPKIFLREIVDKYFGQKVYYDLFTSCGFTIEYPEWPRKEENKGDVILAVSNGPFRMEIYVEDKGPYTFASYSRRLSSAIRDQLGGKLTRKSETVDSAYLEFVIVKGNVLWLYRARVIECNNRFYTVSFSGPKNEFGKLVQIIDHVFGSIECYKPESLKPITFAQPVFEAEAASAETEFSKIEELSPETEEEKSLTAPKPVEEGPVIEKKTEAAEEAASEEKEQAPLIEVSEQREKSWRKEIKQEIPTLVEIGEEAEEKKKSIIEYAEKSAIKVEAGKEEAPKALAEAAPVPKAAEIKLPELETPKKIVLQEIPDLLLTAQNLEKIESLRKKLKLLEKSLKYGVLSQAAYEKSRDKIVQTISKIKMPNP